MENKNLSIIRLIKNLTYFLLINYFKQMDIRLIYSEKPTRLVKIYNDVDKEEFTLKLDAKVNDLFKEYVNVYITPDGSPNCVLTTDKLLIADGVQEIPEEFLKWYIQNPSCEEIEVKAYYATLEDGLTFDRIDYRIILPKVQPKEDDFSSKLKEYYKNIPKDKVLEDWSKSQEFDKIGPIAEEVIYRRFIISYAGNGPDGNIVIGSLIFSNTFLPSHKQLLMDIKEENKNRIDNLFITCVSELSEEDYLNYIKQDE